MADSTPKSYSLDPTLWLYTSLSSGSSQIVTATSRLETILKANKIQFQALDVATDEKARMLWGRRAGKRKLPGLVRMGMVIGDIDEVEEWNEYGELKEQVDAIAPAARTPATSTNNTPSKPPPVTSSLAATSTSVPPSKNTAISFAENIPPKQAQSTKATPKSPTGGVEPSFSLAMRQAGKEAAEKAKSKPKTSAFKSSATPEADLSKLDNSAPSGVPPPSGTTDAASAIAPDTGAADVMSKADAVPVTEEGATEMNKEHETGESMSSSKEASNPEETAAVDVTSAQLDDSARAAKPKEDTAVDVIDSSLEDSEIQKAPVTEGAATTVASASSLHRGSSISVADKDEIRMVEEANKIEEEPEKEEEEAQNVNTNETKTEPETTKPSEEENRGTSDKDKGPHVQFTGEAPGNEMDRVKATLSRDASPNSGNTTQDEKAESGQPETTKAKHEDSTAPKTQDQEAADPQKASESVGD